MSLVRFAASVVTAAAATAILGTLMPGLGLLVAGFLAGVVAGSPAAGAVAALLGSLPVNLLAAHITILLLSMLGCTCNPLIVALVATLVETAAAAAGGAIAARRKEAKSIVSTRRKGWKSPVGRTDIAATAVTVIDVATAA